MPKNLDRRPDDNPPSFNVVPLTQAAPNAVGRKPGRPKKSDMPPMPALKISALEQEMYDFFIQAYLTEYPDLTPSDKLLLQLAGIEYIKYHRVIGFELDNNTTITMARQHPYSQMRGLLDQLSVTRKARKRDQPEEDPQAETRDKLRELFG